MMWTAATVNLLSFPRTLTISQRPVMANVLSLPVTLTTVLSQANV